MISRVLVFLKNHLNSHLRTRTDGTADESHEDKVVFVDGDKMDPISFKIGAVSALLINIEEETTQRAADPYVAMTPQGETVKVNPEIRINLYVLFVARFKQYERGLSYLSQIIQHFQIHRVFEQHNAPDLGEDIDKLVMELITLPFAEQNELWNALRTTYHPSVLYKVKMIAFRDRTPGRTTPVADKSVRLSP